MRGRTADLEEEQRLALRGVKPHCKPFASKVLPPLLRAELSELGMGVGGQVAQFNSGFPLRCTVSEDRVFPLK